MYQHFARNDVAAEYATFDFLFDAEQAILDEMRTRLADARMLDIGVGGGRTTIHFASLVSEYVGVDVSEAMVDACVKRFEGTIDDHVTFRVMDARDLTAFEPASFDFVLFSFNSLDVVGGHEDRQLALREIRRVCGDGALFCFSSHNLAFARHAYSVRGSLDRLFAGVRHPLLVLRRPRQFLRALRRPLLQRKLNPGLRAMARRGYGVVLEKRARSEFDATRDPAMRETIEARKYQIVPDRQVKELHDVGFRNVRMFAPDGTELRAGSRHRRHMWLYYLCERSPASGA